jgi:hypothetical protein
MQIEVPLVKIKLVVEAEVANDEEMATLESDLISGWMAVKSGLYENRVWGTITSVDKLEVGKTTIEVDDEDEDNTEGSF